MSDADGSELGDDEDAGVGTDVFRAS